MSLALCSIEMLQYMFTNYLWAAVAAAVIAGGRREECGGCVVCFTCMRSIYLG